MSWKMDAWLCLSGLSPLGLPGAPSVPITTLGTGGSGSQASATAMSHMTHCLDGASRGVGGGQTDQQPPSDVSQSLIFIE